MGNKNIFGFSIAFLENATFWISCVLNIVTLKRTLKMKLRKEHFI